MCVFLCVCVLAPLACACVHACVRACVRVVFNGLPIEELKGFLIMIRHKGQESPGAKLIMQGTSA